MPSCLASHHICELYHAILFFHYVLHLSTMLVHSTTLPVHQPFDTVMEKSGVKTRSSEQTVLSDEAHTCRLQIAPQRRIQGQMTSRISPQGV